MQLNFIFLFKMFCQIPTKFIFLAAIITVFIYEYSSTEAIEFKFDLKHIDNDQRDRLFNYLDINRDNSLKQSEFQPLFKSLFYSTKHNKTYVKEESEAKLFGALDFNEDKRINRLEFNQIWDQWIRIILQPRSALIVVDMQNDFIADGLGSDTYTGSLLVPNGKHIVPAINYLIENVNFDTIVYTYDWHPSNHCSFIENINLREVIEPNNTDHLLPGAEVRYKNYPNIPQRLWPSHCVQNTFGAELYQGLIATNDSIRIAKGVNPDIDSYSAFKDNVRSSKTELEDNLKRKGITDVYLTGVVYEFCVGETAVDALELGYRTAFIENAVQFLNKTEMNEMRNKLSHKLANFVEYEDVLDMVNGRDRTIEMGLVLAHKVFNKNQRIEENEIY